MTDEDKTHLWMLAIVWGWVYAGVFLIVLCSE